MGAVKIPAGLLERAEEIPGLAERVARFIKFEVAQFEKRQKRFRPETLALVARARTNAEEKRAAGVDLEDEKTAFVNRLDEMVASKEN